MKILPLLLLLLLLLGISFYLVLAQGAQESVTEQLLSRQQLIVRAEKSNIITFFEKHGNSMATLAQLKSIETRDKDTAYDLDLFVEQRKDTGIISGVVLTDKRGLVEYNSNVTGIRDLGQSVADRNFFTWARDEAKRGEYYISKPTVGKIGAVKDQVFISVASPVFRNNTFTGVLSSGVKLQPLLERFFGIMKISEETQVYLVDERGDLLYSNAEDREAFSDQAFSDRIKNALGATEEGRFSTDKYLAAYSPVTLGVQKWLLVISSPAQEITEHATPYYIRQAVIFTAVALTILLVGVVANRKKEA